MIRYIARLNILPELLFIVTLSDITTENESPVTGVTGGKAVFTLEIKGKYEGISFKWNFGSTEFDTSMHKEVLLNLYPAV